MLDLNLNLNLGLASVFGDPTALTQNNADSLFTSLGLTQAGTGTTWGETGNDEIPLYSVDAAKVPLTVEEINGKKYFGPIVNPAGTNLALYSSDATNAAWVKSNMTAALALGGLEHDADWRGDEELSNGSFDTTDNWTLGTGWSIAGGNLSHDGSSASNTYQASILEDGKFYIATLVVSSVTGFPDLRVRTSNGGISVNSTGFSTVGTHEVIFQSIGTQFAVRQSVAGHQISISSISVKPCDAHTLLTSSSDNATAVTSITSTGGERVSKFWVQTEDEDVFVSHGAPTGSALYDDNFDSDTSGEWSRGSGSVDGTIAVSGGALVHTKGAGDSSYPRFVRPITGFTVGKFYRLVETNGGTANSTNRGIVITSSSNGTGGITAFDNSPATVYFQATASTMYLALLLFNAGIGETATLDNVFINEVAETELTPSSNLVPVDLAATSFANPQLGIRIANSGDSVRLYGVQHQVAARPLRPYVGPTTSSTVTSGARTLTDTISPAPTEIDVELILKFPNTASTRYPLEIYNDGSNYIAFACYGTTIELLSRASAVNQSASFTSAVEGTVYKVRLQVSASLTRLTVNGTAYNAASPQMPGGLSYWAIGTRANTQPPTAGYFGEPILAFRDNIGNLLDGNLGWNHRLLDNWA